MSGVANVSESRGGEGFLKSAWNKLTHNNENELHPGPDASQNDAKRLQEEPKRAAGSG